MWPTYLCCMISRLPSVHVLKAARLPFWTFLDANRTYTEARPPDEDADGVFESRLPKHLLGPFAVCMSKWSKMHLESG